MRRSRLRCEGKICFSARHVYKGGEIASDRVLRRRVRVTGLTMMLKQGQSVTVVGKAEVWCRVVKEITGD